MRHAISIRLKQRKEAIMIRKRAALAAGVLLLAVLACSPLGGEESHTPTPTLAPADESPCGDGVCDEVEQANPALCPQDCAAAGGGPADSASSSGDEAAEGNWWAEVTWGCDLVPGGGSEDHWTVDIVYEFTVGSDGQLRGSGQGEGRRISCKRPGCECTLTLDPFQVTISGLKQEEYFSIQMDPEYNMEEYVFNCPGGVPPGGGQVYQLDLCICQPGGPHDITLEAQDGAYTEFECPVPGGTAMGWVTLHQGEP
jgi:hypothetical protein